MPRTTELPSAGTVTVACNHPPGLLLHLDEMVEQDVPVLGGGTKTVKVARRVGPEVKINGPAVPHGVAPKFVIVGATRAPDGSLGRDGYALTPNVDAEFFRKWMEQNKDTALVQNRVIYALEKDADAKAWATDNKDARSGLEPLNPKNDPRRPKTSNPNVKDIETADLEAA